MILGHEKLIAQADWVYGTQRFSINLLLLAKQPQALNYFFTPAKIGGLSYDSYLIIYAVFALFVSWFI